VFLCVDIHKTCSEYLKIFFFGVFQCALKRDECFISTAGYEEKIKQHTSKTKRAVKGVLVFFIELLMRKSTDSQTV